MLSTCNRQEKTADGRDRRNPSGGLRSASPIFSLMHVPALLDLSRFESAVVVYSSIGGSVGHSQRQVVTVSVSPTKARRRHCGLWRAAVKMVMMGWMESLCCKRETVVPAPVIILPATAAMRCRSRQGCERWKGVDRSCKSSAVTPQTWPRKSDPDSARPCIVVV